MLNPFNFGTPVPPNKMVGRSHQIKTIASDLINPGGLSHAVIGGRRFGKSSFLESLQDYLARQVEQTRKENWYVLPFLINFKRLPEKSAEGVYGFILKIIYKYFTDSRTQKKLGLQIDFNLQKTLLLLFCQNKRKKCSQEEFSEILDEIQENFASTHGSLRFVLLMDEVEEILDEDWSEALFSQLRSLIYEWLLRDSMRYVIVGSSQVIEVREKGSPLLNMLKITHLEAIEDKHVFEIINWMPDVPLDVGNAVLEISGGHPFITQYIMHYLYECGMENVKISSISRIAKKFIFERLSDLEQWKHDIGEIGLRVRQILVEKNSWLTEEQIRNFLDNPQISIERALIRLCYHGLVIHKDWSEYHWTASLLSLWPEIAPEPPPNGGSTTFKVFISYAHEDQALREELDKHLSNLKRLQIISSWYDGDIIPGTERQPQIIEQFQAADIILLLVSADFIASDFAYSVMLKQAIARHDAHKAYVIPILVRPCDWKDAPFAKLEMLPTGAKAVTRWLSHDEAFEDVVQGIRRALSVAPVNGLSNGGSSVSGPSGTSPIQGTQQPAFKPIQPKPVELKIPEMGNYFLSGEDREDLLNILDTVIGEISTIDGIKALLRGILPDSLINRINYKDASRNIADNIVGILVPRGALNQHYHTLGAFLNNLLEDQSVSVSYDASVTIVSLLFRYTLVTDRQQIEKLSGQFQVPIEG